MAPMFGGVEGMAVMVDRFDVTDIMSVDDILTEVDVLLTSKLELITPAMVKELLEEVVRVHLGWLVVWG
eukprot:CAMPEP_0119465590 /NCGR_PEP_ID=MMETSP1344-20130328/648_1 /TAXON_ID=236787 /ORGANISM="Florenciella parvula, Strain CCMP2471" /LENGTH=68 /DNA_ID=CAMNT_0007497859 /DNA_START=42 /DNA_END=244 /DNA_ORIENTATION=-